MPTAGHYRCFVIDGSLAEQLSVGNLDPATLVDATELARRQLVVDAAKAIGKLVGCLLPGVQKTRLTVGRRQGFILLGWIHLRFCFRLRLSRWAGGVPLALPAHGSRLEPVMNLKFKSLKIDKLNGFRRIST